MGYEVCSKCGGNGEGREYGVTCRRCGGCGKQYDNEDRNDEYDEDDEEW